MYGFNHKQLIVITTFTGTTQRSQPTGSSFPDGFHVTQNSRHWANEGTVLQYVDNILIPYIDEVRHRNGTPEQRALLIFDVFRGHLTSDVKSKLENNLISYVTVPNNMTNIFQPLDVSVNKAAKSELKKCYI